MNMDKLHKKIFNERKAEGLFVRYIKLDGTENHRTFANEKHMAKFLHILEVRGDKVISE